MGVLPDITQFCLMVRSRTVSEKLFNFHMEKYLAAEIKKFFTSNLSQQIDVQCPV